MSEYAGQASRGMLVTLVFTMQAAGLILGPSCAAVLLKTSLSHDLIWRILVAFGAVPALAVYWQRRHLRETPRFLAATGQEEDEHGRMGKGEAFRPIQAFGFFLGRLSPLGEQQPVALAPRRDQRSLVLNGRRLLRKHRLQPP
jgi:MFS family permease